MLEQIRLISNLETDTEKLIQIVLMGQSELQEMLARRELRQLAQRVTARYHLSPLEPPGDRGLHPAPPGRGRGRGQGLLHRRTRSPPCTSAPEGIPRLVNLICDRALLAGTSRGRARSTRRWCGARPARCWPPAPRRAARAQIAASSPRSRWRRWARPRPGADGSAGAGDRGPRRRPGSAAAAAVTVPAALASPSAASRPVRRSPCPASASYDAARGQVQRAVGRRPPSSARPCARTWTRCGASTCPWCSRCSIPRARDTCYLALLRIEGDHAIVATGSGAPLRVPLAELDRLWTRQAVFLWRDFDALSGGRRSRPHRGLGAGQPVAPGLPRGDPDLAGAVARFQRDADLAADGVIGARTLMTLYSRGSYPRPRLQGGTS